MSTVDQIASDTATVAGWRRMVRRALLVIGGSVAGTAIAWAVSSASASADPTCQAPVLEPVAGIEQLAGPESAQLVQPLSDVVCTVGQVVPVPSITGLGTEARLAADEFGRQLASEIGFVPGVPIDLSELGRGDRPGTTPGGGAHEPPSLMWPVGEQSAAAPASTIAPNAITHGAAVKAIDRALGDGMTRRGSPEPAPAPLAPGNPTPGAPATMPGTGSSGHSSGSADSPAFAALGFGGRQFDLTRGQTLADTEAVSFGEAGAQPGVTPD
jgi:hypothetical protein